MRVPTALALTALLFLALPAGVLGSASAEQAAPNASLEPADPPQQLTVALETNGDAEWTVEHRSLIESDEDRERFEAFAEEYTAGDPDVSAFEPSLELARESVDRQMTLEDVRWNDTHTVTENASDGDGEREVGVISYSFTWTDFADSDGNRVYLGDVFRSGDGTWLSLTEDQRLTIVRPAGFGYEDVNHGPSGDELVWDGPHEFTQEELSVVYLEGASVPGTATEPPGDGNGLGAQLAAGLGVVVLLALVGGGYYVHQRRPFDSDDDSAGETAARATNEGDADPTDAEPASDTHPSDDAKPATTSFDEAEQLADEPPVDPELLSDEERVLRLLRRNGGRMKQANIVTETGWSNAKVSQLLSQMDDDEEIEKLRIGRENLITLPDVDLTEIE